MVNVYKLKGKIVEKRMSIEELSEKMGMNKSTFYRRLNEGGVNITIEEADLIAQILNLSSKEVDEIFFSQFVAKDEN